MRAPYRIAFLVAATLIFTGRIKAHHSYAATYYVDRTQTVEGEIVEFLYRNPHSYVRVRANDEKGESQVWAIEWAGVPQLAEDHITRDSLKPGDHVVVTGNPGRDATSHRIRMQSITRPSDGWKWSGTVR